MENGEGNKMKILCIHGFRTSGAFLNKQISKWDPSIFAHFHLSKLRENAKYISDTLSCKLQERLRACDNVVVTGHLYGENQRDFPDGLFPAGGKSDIEGIFPPPYFEWFQFNKEFTEYSNLEECISYLCDYITTNGPFDGLLGFSQGATLSALLAGYQLQGKVLTDHPPIKFIISVSGSKFRAPHICDVAFKDPITAKSVHFIGEKDWLKLPSEDLATAFVDPLIIRHPQGHTVPRLDEAATEQLVNWTKALLALTSAATDDARNAEAKSDEKVKEDSIDTKMETTEVEAVQA